jgi:hypothetical protein
MRKLILVLACVIIAGSTIANANEKLVDLVKCEVKPSGGQLVFICIGLATLVVAIVTKKLLFRSNSSLEASQASVQPSTYARYGLIPYSAVIFGIICGLLGSVVFFVKSVHIFAVRNAPIVTGHIVAREPFLHFSMPRTDFTIRIDGTQTEVHAYPPDTEIPEVVRFHYSGDPAREVFLFEYEEPYYWITLFFWGGTAFLVVILVISRRTGYSDKIIQME